MNALINISAFDIESIDRNLDIFLRWKNAVFQKLETWWRRDCTFNTYWIAYEIARLGFSLMTKIWQSTHQVWDSVLGYYMWRFYVR